MLSATIALWEYRDLVRNLVAKDIRVRYMDATIGFAWALVNPLVITSMYLVVFTFIFRPATPNFALYLVTGILHWTLFSQNVAQSCELLVGNAGLIKKIYFPRILVPFSNLLVNLVLWMSALSVYMVLFPFMGGRYSLVLLAYPAYLLMFVGFTFGLGLILTTLFVSFRDLKHIVEVALQVLFWGTPILYPLELIPSEVRGLIMLSPLVEFTEIFHQILYANQLPTLQLTLAFFTWTVVAISLGLWLFIRRVPRMVEDL